MANILVHFRNVDPELEMNGGQAFKDWKRDADLIGNIDVVIADLGFAKQL